MAPYLPPTHTPNPTGHRYTLTPCPSPSSKAIFLMSGVALLTLLVNGTTVGSLLKSIGLISVSEASQMAFADRCHELEIEVEADLTKILQVQRQEGRCRLLLTHSPPLTTTHHHPCPPLSTIGFWEE